MSGTALKSFGPEWNPASRLTKEEYELVSKEILHMHRDIEKIAVTRAIGEKQDFGDIDIIVGYPDTLSVKEAMDNFLTSFSEVNKYVINGNMVSVGYQMLGRMKENGEFFEKHIQVDFILVPESDFDFAVEYYSNNDFSMLIGMLVHSRDEVAITEYGDIEVRPRLCHDGVYLSSYLRDANGNASQLLRQVKFNIKYWDFIRAVCIGFDETHGMGHQITFNTYEEMFLAVANYHWTAMSTITAESIFGSDAMTNDDRKRNTKRGSYQLFRKWMEENGVTHFYKVFSGTVFITLFYQLFESGNTEYGSLRDFMDQSTTELKKIYINKRFKAKFNVGSVHDNVTHSDRFSDKDIGEAMHFALHHAIPNWMLEFVDRQYQHPDKNTIRKGMLVQGNAELECEYYCCIASQLRNSY